MQKQEKNDFTISLQYLHEHSNLKLWSYKKGKLYRLSNDLPKTVKMQGKMYQTDPQKWEIIDYLPPFVKIKFKLIGSKKIFWLKEQ